MNVILLLLSAQPSTEISLDFLAESDSEWVAPGWEVFERVEINPLDYVEPLRQDQEGPAIGCLAFEVQDQDSSCTWRLVICGRNRLAVFQGKNEAPGILDLPFPAVGLVCSRNGDYALVLGHTEAAGLVGRIADINGLRLGDEFDLITYPTGYSQYVHLVSNRGALVSFYRVNVGPYAFADSCGLVSSSQDEWLTTMRPILSPRGDSWFASACMADRSIGDLFSFDMEGSVIWSVHGPGLADVSPDGSVVFAFDDEGRLSALSADDGRTIWSEVQDSTANWSLSSYDNRPMLYQHWGEDGSMGIVLRAVDRETSPGSLAYTVSSHSIFWESVSMDGYKLCRIRKRYMPGIGYYDPDYCERLVVISPGGEPVWASEPRGFADRQFSLRGNLSEFSLRGGGLWSPVIASSGDSIYVISTPRQVTITGIRRVE